MDILTTAGVWSAVITVVIGVIGMVVGFWRQAVREGMRQQRLEEQAKDIGHAHEKIRTIEQALRDTDAVIIRQDEKLTTILTVLNELRLDFKDHMTQK